MAARTADFPAPSKKYSLSNSLSFSISSLLGVTSVLLPVTPALPPVTSVLQCNAFKLSMWYIFSVILYHSVLWYALWFSLWYTLWFTLCLRVCSVLARHSCRQTYCYGRQQDTAECSALFLIREELKSLEIILLVAAGRPLTFRNAQEELYLFHIRLVLPCMMEFPIHAAKHEIEAYGMLLRAFWKTGSSPRHHHNLRPPFKAMGRGVRPGLPFVLGNW